MELEEWLEIDDYERLETGEGPVAVSRYMPPKEKLAIRLYGTEWRLGQLTIRLQNDEAESEPGVERFVAHPLDLAMHPRRGIVNTRVFSFGDEMSGRGIREFVESSAERLQMTTDVIRKSARRHLRSTTVSEIWEDRSLPIEPIYVMHRACAEIDPETVGIDPDRVIRAPWSALPDRLDEKMPELAAVECSDPFQPVEVLNEAVRSMTRHSIDHESYIQKWEVVSDQLFDDQAAA